MKAGGTTPVSLFTACTYLTPQPSTSLQSREEISPRNWRWSTDEREVCEAILEKLNEHDDLFRKFRVEFIDSCLKDVHKEHSVNGTNIITDHIDRAEPVLPGVAKLKRETLYKNVPEKHMERPVVSGAEPVFKNPGCKEDLFVILGHIEQICNVGETDNGRKWVVDGCDGSPYILAQKIIDETFQCSECGAKISGEQDFREHSLTDHGCESPTMNRRFGDVLLRMGAGLHT